MPLRIVPDTSAIIGGGLREELSKMEATDVELIIPLAVLDELQAQASKGRETGFIGLEELRKIRGVCAEREIKMRFEGERPGLDEIRLAKSGRIDAIITDIAMKEGATLITSDHVQSLVARAQGIEVKYVPPEAKVAPQEISFEKWFTEGVASLHLKEGAPILAKVGKPGEFKLVRLSDRPLAAEELEEMIREISEAVRRSPDGFIELSRSGATVFQLGHYRIAIARPPFSDGLEVTIVRPLVSLRLEDYNLSEKLLERLRTKAEGIIIAGPPGSGKTTFASSLAEDFMRRGKIVKTFESPRDLQVSPEITQYGPLEGDFEKTAEILLLVRPDYTVFDEIRKTKDFHIFADMRLAGVGMIGVVHASDAIDAIERFIGRVELGMIPHIVDTIIFIRYGLIEKVYKLDLVVKVPTGMTEADLTRPVVEVRDFETDALEYEIYSYGEENVIVPIKRAAPSAAKRLAEERIGEEVFKFDPNARVELVSDNKAIVRVSNEVIPILIGRKGEVISKLERKLGIKIDVEPLAPALGEEVNFTFAELGNRIELRFGDGMEGKVVSVYADGEYLFSATVGKRGVVKVSKRSDIGKSLLRAYVSQRKIKSFVAP